MAKIKLTPLGSMGWIPTGNRHTCSYCLEYNDNLVILDAGTGISRFDEPWGRAILDRYDKLTILLSHYHLDHVTGLIYLSYFFKGKTVHIAGPGPSVYGANRGAKQILGDLINHPYFARPMSDFPVNLEIHDLDIGLNSIDGIRIETILRQHTDPCLGIKIEDSVCYLTDTACDLNAVDFVRGCKLLLHEAWFDNHDLDTLSRLHESNPDMLKHLQNHASADCAAQVAKNAGVDALLLIHLNPAYDNERLLAMERDAQRIFPNSHIAVEGGPYG